MARSYYSTWQVKSLAVNFNLKQWRQDIGEFIRSKKFWDGTTRVTRARTIPNNSDIVAKGVKQFKVYNAYGGEVIIQFQNNSELLYTNEIDLVNDYLKKRGKFDEN